MSGAFGGGDYIRDQFPQSYEEYLAKKEGRDGTATGGKFVTFDNTIGEVTLRVPPEFERYQAELLEELTMRYYGEAAGDPKVLDEMNTFVGEWLQKKAKEEEL
ncbi:hypothetical protein ACFL59_00165 [Planctomycetota bacterium]